MKGRRGPQLCGAWLGGRADGPMSCFLAGGLPSGASLARAGAWLHPDPGESSNAPNLPLGGLEKPPT